MAAVAVTLAVKVGLSELAQHTARLKGAENENQAADQLIPAFDADLAQIAAAYNSGATDAGTCVKACQAVLAQCYSYLYAQVGKPGTAWNSSGNCDKSCTAGCCIYYNDLAPAINGSPVFANGTVGFIPVLKVGSGTVYVPEVYPPSNTDYGNYARDSYTITITKPAPAVVVETNISSTVGQALGISTTPGVGVSSGLSLTTITTVASLIAALIAIAAFLHIGGAKSGG
jgi:hypothetical protein